MPDTISSPPSFFITLLKKVTKHFGLTLLLLIVTWATLDGLATIALGHKTDGGYLRLEFWLYLGFFYGLWYLQKANKRRLVLTLFMALLPYIILNLYIIMFARLFKLSDLKQVPELLDVLSWIELVLYFMPMILIVGLYASNLSRRFYKRSVLAFSPITTIFVLALLFPQQFDAVFKGVGGRVINWSEQKMAANNGYLITTLFFHARELNNQTKLANYSDGNAWHEAHKKADWLANNAQSRNVHWIVLESFFDPQDMKNLTFDHATFHADFTKLIAGRNDYLTSSVFGGGTSNAEFELLCSVPALRALGGIDFNSFTGASTFCNPWLFQQAGWNSINTKAYKPWYFNTFAAYQGVGFEERHFPRSYGHGVGEPSYLDLVADEPFLFDGDLFDQNLAYLASKKSSQPVFNYMLAVYGHNHHYLDEGIFKRIIHPTLKGKPLSLKASSAINQMYYRTKAIADLVNRLKIEDPDALVVLMSDHLPAMSGTGFFNDVGYLADHQDAIHQLPAYVFDRGERIDLAITQQYHMGDLVFDLLSEGKYCQEFECYQSRAELKDQYYAIMANAVLAD